jgi:4-hydroxybenzoate polyprenyltransferase
MNSGFLQIRKLTDLILYSSFWISACAAALVSFTYDVTGRGIQLDAYVGFVFCGTLVIYAIHRLTGIEHVKQFQDQGRFAVIRRYRSHILIYGIIAVLGACYFLTQMSWSLIWWLAIPALLSFLYVAPLGRLGRLRDIPLVKIFLISGVWAALTGLIPFVHTGLGTPMSGSLLFFERALFIFAITIPFDIRDIHVDATSDLRTLPQAIGIRKSKVLALALLGVSAMLTCALIRMEVYNPDLYLPYFICAAITAFLIWFSLPALDDYYFSGLLDGTMFLLPFLYWVNGLVH